MADVTIKQLAQVLDTSADKLLAQLGDAGMEFSDPDQAVSDDEKRKLLDFLRSSHGRGAKVASDDDEQSPRKITLRRRKVSELEIGGGAKGRGRGRGAASKTVSVEVRGKRTYVKRSDITEEEQATSEREDALRKLEESRERTAEEEAERERQRQQREQAREERERQAEEDKRQREQARERAEAEAKAAAEPEAAEEPVAAAEPVAAEPAAEPETKSSEPALAVTPADLEAAADSGKHGARKVKETDHQKGDKDHGKRGAAGRRKLHLSESDRARRSSRKRARPTRGRRAKGGGGPHGFSRPVAPQVRDVPVGDNMVVSDLAQRMAIKGADVVKVLFNMGVMATINQTIDHDTATLVVEEMGHNPVVAEERGAESVLLERQQEASAEGETSPRAPVVTIMGHVDHGKTSLLDTIRRTKVATGEEGGITQHIGAYHVDTAKGGITFLDTPGHAAFTAMRARGARSTDIVVLIVAADDGVMPQTVEAIKHAKAAEVPIIVAVNKIDKDDANPDNVKQGLAQEEVIPEDWGGDVQFVPVSAKSGEGIDTLLDAISLQAEILELKAAAEGNASGAVIESRLERGRGPVATLLVQQGSLSRGDFVVCGTQYGRVRALFDENGDKVEAAGPSMPVEVLGLSGVPDSGDDFVVVADERLAKKVADERDTKRRESRLTSKANRLEDIMAQMGQGDEQQKLNILVKADVRGSAEALRDSLTEISNDDIKIAVITAGVGGITESDATLAAASNALIIGFNVRADPSARKVIETSGLDLRYFSIIYDVIDQVRQVATGLLGNEIREEIVGTAEVRDVFRSSRFGAVAGCMVVEGAVKHNLPIRVLRDDTVIFEGELESLRRLKDDVAEVRGGTECGIGVKQYSDVKVGDRIECFKRIEVARTL